MLNIGNRDDGMTIQITHLPACAVFLLDIPVCDLTFLLQSVLQSVVKALFDIESDFVKVNIHMGCNAVNVALEVEKAKEKKENKETLNTES